VPDPDPRLVAAATALAMTDLRRCGKTAPAVLERVLPYYMAAAEVCVSAYLATPAELGTEPEAVPARDVELPPTPDDDYLTALVSESNDG
jgi:hypothetical protein